MDGAGEGSRQDEPENCLEEQAVLDFAAGVIPAHRLADIEHHLAGCDRCAELVMLAAAPASASGTGTDLAPTTHAQAPGMRPRGAGALLQPNVALNDTYRIVRFIGEGGMGEVYEVSHARLAGRYAAKVLSLDLAKNAQAFSRFRREAQIASGLSHPNIVHVIDFSELEDGRPFLVMEFLDGQDLGQILTQGALPLDRTMRLVEQIVSALAVLHGHRIVHRDLKPQNIFVLPGKDGDSEHVKLVDFGLAKRASPSMAVTRERSLLGTPQYMSPEQAIGKADSLGPEADQFALAALVYEMLSGKPAFEGDVLSMVLYRIVYEMPQPLRQLAPKLPAWVYAAVERGLAKAPTERFPSIKAFLNQLQSTGPAAVDWHVGRRVLPHLSLGHKRWFAGAVAALAILGGAVLWRGRMRVAARAPVAAMIYPSAPGRNEVSARPAMIPTVWTRSTQAGLPDSSTDHGTGNDQAPVRTVHSHRAVAASGRIRPRVHPPEPSAYPPATPAPAAASPTRVPRPDGDTGPLIENL
jgi:tRNA A-37 threonylcarbamoyl transferase component Bud32